MAARKAVTAAAWVTAEKQYADHSIKVSDIAQSLGLTSIELSTAARSRLAVAIGNAPCCGLEEDEPNGANKECADCARPACLRHDRRRVEQA